MPKSKLHQVLEHFSRVELNRLEKFVASPYFNSNEVVLQIFREVRKSILNDEVLTDQQLMHRAAPGDTDLSSFRKKMSLLIKLVQDFLAQESFQDNQMHRVNYLLEAHREKKIPVLEPSSIRMADRLINRQLYLHADYHLQTYKLLRNKYELSNVEVTRDKKGVLQKYDPESIDNSLDDFYFVEKLRLMISLLYWRNVYEHDYDLTFFREITDYIESNPKQSIAVKMYFQVYKTYSDPDEDEHYYKLFGLIQEHISDFPPNEANNILESAINYCIRRLNLGSQKYLEESLKLYKEGIRTEILFRNGVITPVTFRNICTIAMRLKEYKWVGDFIKNHNHRIPDKSRESIVHLARAQLFFYQDKFEEVLPLLQNYVSQDDNLNLGARLLYCAALYELDYDEVLESAMASFKVQLHRSKSVSNKVLTQYKRFLYYLDRILRNTGNHEKLLDLLRMIDEKRDATTSFWLKAKIQEIVGEVT